MDSVNSRVIRTLTLGLPPSGLGSYNSTIDLGPVYNYHIYPTSSNLYTPDSVSLARQLEMCSVSTNDERARPAQYGLADRVSFFLQDLISMSIYKFNIYLNIKNWFTSVFINGCWLFVHRPLDDGYPRMLHIHTHIKCYMLIR